MLRFSQLKLGSPEAARPVDVSKVLCDLNAEERERPFRMEQFWRRSLTNVEVMGIEYRSSLPASLQFQCQPGFHLHLRLCGSGHYAIDNESEINGKSCELQFFSSQFNWCKTVIEPSSAFNRTIVVASTAQSLRYFLGPSAERFLGQGSKSVSHIRIPVDHLLRQAAEELLSLDSSKSIHALFKDSRLYEVTAYCFESLLKVGSEPVSAPTIRKRDVDHVNLAVEILLAEISNSPTIKELSRRVGLNSCKLKQVFKMIKGCTIGRFVRDARLDRAAYMLRQDANVDRVAYEMGYLHAGNFAKVFRERFGVNPSDYRKKFSSGIVVNDSQTDDAPIVIH